METWKVWGRECDPDHILSDCQWISLSPNQILCFTWAFGIALCRHWSNPLRLFDTHDFLWPLAHPTSSANNHTHRHTHTAASIDLLPVFEWFLPCTKPSFFLVDGQWASDSVWSVRDNNGLFWEQNMEGKWNSVIETRRCQVGQQDQRLVNSAQKYKAEELCWNSVGQMQKSVHFFQVQSLILKQSKNSDKDKA